MLGDSVAKDGDDKGDKRETTTHMIIGVDI
jgi:hypothetical protein